MYLFRKIVETLGGNLSEIVGGFGLTFFMTCQFTIEEAGIWMWWMAILATQSKIREGFTQMVLVQYGCQGAESERASFQKLTFYLTLGFELVIFLAWGFLAGFMAARTTALLVPMMLFSVANAVFRWWLFLWQGKLLTQRAAGMQASYSLFLLAIFAIAWWFRWGMAEITLWMASGRLVALVIFLKGQELKSWYLAPIKKRMLKTTWHFVKSGLLREVSGSIAARSQVLLTAGFLSFSEIAWIGIAWRYAQLMLLPNGSVQSIVYARACEWKLNQPAKNAQSLFGFALVSLWALFGLFVITFAFTGSWFLQVFHGSGYSASFPVVLFILVQVSLFAPAGTLFGSMTFWSNHPLLSAKLVLTNSLLTIVFVSLAGHFWGLWGVLTASFSVEISGFLLINHFLKKHLNTSWKQLISEGMKEGKNMLQKAHSQYSWGF